MWGRLCRRSRLWPSWGFRSLFGDHAQIGVFQRRASDGERRDFGNAMLRGPIREGADDGGREICRDDKATVVSANLAAECGQWHAGEGIGCGERYVSNGPRAAAEFAGRGDFDEPAADDDADT